MLGPGLSTHSASTPQEAAARPFEQSLYWLQRVALGVFLLAAGTGKALDVPGYTAVIETFRLGLPAVLLWPSAMVIVVVELGLGVAILAGSVRAALGSAARTRAATYSWRSAAEALARVYESVAAA